MEQLEKLTPEQKKLYESLMAYDSVMTNWLDAKEENRIKFKSNPIKAFLDATGMGNEEFLAMMHSLDNRKALSEYMDDGNKFELDEAKTSYTNGWDIVNLATVDVINLVLKKLFGDGIQKDYFFKVDEKKTDVTVKVYIEPLEIKELNGTLANMRLMLKDCMILGELEGTPVGETIDEIIVCFDVMLQQVSLETESGKTLDLYLDIKAQDAIKNPSVDVKSDNLLLKYVLKGVIEDGIQKIIDSIPMDEPYKICSIGMDAEKLQKEDWIIPDYASFSGSDVAMENGEFKKEVAVFAKTLDKNVADLNLNIQQQFADSKADGTLGIAERLTLGYILPVILAQALNDNTVSMEYDEKENYLKIDKTESISQSGADVKIKDFKVSSRENGFRLAFYIDGNWGAGMVKFNGPGYCDIRLEFVNNENGESQLLVSVSNPTLNCNTSVPWWEYLIMCAIAVATFIGGIIAAILLNIINIATAIIDSVINRIQNNGIDGLPVNVAIPIKWNNLELLDIESMNFSKGLHISYSMKVDQESIKQQK